MAVHEMFLACKSGDALKLKHLVEMKEMDVNIRDKWDNTPLYYACLCGHREIVEYLLENGAKCQTNTFERKHCSYGALSDDIKNLLSKPHILSSRTKRRSPYEEFLRRLFETRPYADIIFNIHGESIPAHKCVISSRCEFFANMLITKWQNQDTVDLNDGSISKSKAAFKSLLQYLYTGQMEIPLDLVDDCILLAKNVQLKRLVKAIEQKRRKTISRKSLKLGVTITTLVVEPSDVGEGQVNSDMGILAQRAVPSEYQIWVKGELPFEQEWKTYPDVCFVVDGHTFECHKAFFCSRSDYFKALLEDHFHENESKGGMQVTPLNDIALDVFVRILFYLYTESCDLPLEIVGEVLVAADMMLLPGLKSLCSSALITYVNESNVASLIRTSRMFNLPKLESACSEFIANNVA